MKLVNFFLVEGTPFKPDRTGLQNDDEMYWDEFEQKYPEAAKSFPGGYYTSSTTFVDSGGGKFSSKGGFTAQYDPMTRKWEQEKEPEEWTTL